MVSLFDETYGKYYQIISELINRCIEEEWLSEEKAREIIRANAFSSETEWVIIDQIKEGKWSVLEYDEELKTIATPFFRKPKKLPFSNIEKAWMKSLLNDQKMRLFKPVREGFDDIEPLFSENDYRVFDKAADPDPYNETEYQERFRILCEAVVNGYGVNIKYKDQQGEIIEVVVIPKLIEYSHKDDKFRLIAADEVGRRTINLGRIESCEYSSGQMVKGYTESIDVEKKTLAIELTDERNALERAATHFSQYGKKKITRLSDKRYYIEYEYDGDVEKEVAMKIISFGDTIKVIKPESVVSKVKDRLSRQQKILNSNKKL